MAKRFFLVAFLFAVLVACNDRLVKSDFKATQDGSWNRDSIAAFTFTGLDTTQQYNMFINVRNDDHFPYSNLFLIAELEFPDGETQRDTLEYEMAQADGAWLGEGQGSIKESKLWYRENISFPQQGVYTLKLAHAMRKNGNVEGVEDLEGITDVGYQIEKTAQ